MTREEAIKVLNMVEAHGIAEEAKQMAIKALEQNESAEEWYKLFVEKFESCEDAISRDAAINIASLHCLTIDETVKAIKNLPSVTHKSGKWINDKNDMPICSQCGYIPQYDRAIDDYEYSNYCPSCGAKMESEEQTE